MRSVLVRRRRYPKATGAERCYRTYLQRESRVRKEHDLPANIRVVLTHARLPFPARPAASDSIFGSQPTPCAASKSEHERTWASIVPPNAMFRRQAYRAGAVYRDKGK